MTTFESNPSPAPHNRDLPLKPMQTKKQHRFNSIGTRLFLSVMGSALVGLGGMAYFFYGSLKTHVESELKDILSNKVSLIDNKLAQAQTMTDTFSASISALHSQKINQRQTYIKLNFETFEQRPDFVKGIGFAQGSFGVLKNQQWFYPYFYVDTGDPKSPGKLLPAPYKNIRYVDENEPGDFYPQTDYYKEFFLPQKPIWTDPYIYFNLTLISYYNPIYDDKKQWLGAVGVDLYGSSFDNEIKGAAINKAGYFAVLTEGGVIVSYPSDPNKAQKLETYKSISGLGNVWTQIKQGKSGLVEKDNNYWIYQRIPRTNWIALASVPQSVVLGSVLLISLGGTIAVGVLLAVVVILFVQRLNRRLQPILNECNKLAQTDAETNAQLQKQDEIERLSTSFYQLLAQVAANEQQIRQEVARTVQSTEQLKQATQEQQENEALQAEVNHILDVVLAVETGDLTVQANVSDRATGLVADTLNRLIEELSRIMFAVLSTAQQVTHGAGSLEQLAISVAEQAQQQAKSVSDVEALMVNFNHLSESTALQAVVSDQAVEQAQVAVNQGQQEMSKMAIEIEVLQKGTEQIVKRAEMLTNFVAMSASFAKDQKRVAALTRVLALNASMIASRASQQDDPQQFASVAREFETVASQVNDLAIQTNQSLLLLQQRTDQIQTVVSGINQDLVEISNSVNQFIVSVDRSGDVFDHIKTVTDRVAEVGIQVTESSQAIATTAKSTLRSIQDIAEVAAKTEHDSRFTREQAGLMDRLATTLLEKVQFFRLSADPSTINLPPDQYQQLSPPKTSVGSD